MKKTVAIIVLFTVHFFVYGQISSYNFRSLTTNDGLSDGMVRAVSQDKYGFIWIGTSYGLNRFDGVTIKTFFTKKGDSTSIPDNYVKSIFLDRENELWISTLRGFSRYDYSDNFFINYPIPYNMLIDDIYEDENGKLWLATNFGLWFFDKQAKAVKRFTSKDSIEKKLNCYIYEIVGAQNRNLYMATSCGVKIFNPATSEYSEIKYDTTSSFSLSNRTAYSVAVDKSGYIWAACPNSKFLLNRIDLKNHSVKQYDYFTDPQKKWTTNTLSRLMIDNRGRLWGGGAASGLFMYDEKNDRFLDYKNDPVYQNTILSNPGMSLYQDRAGNIWVGTVGFGISYFNPDNNLFYSILPIFKNQSQTGIWCRAVCEDDEGNLWLGTGAGISKYNRNKQLFTEITNNDPGHPGLHSNSVRSLLRDDNGDMWIGTANGLNRYHPSTGKMDFFTEKDGISPAFFWMMAKTSANDVWFGSAWGLYRYLRKENRFDNLQHDSLLSKYAFRNVQALFCDSKDRLWIGLLDVGLVMYDPVNKKIDNLTIKDSFITDTRFSSFAEDRNGIIWIGSENGLTAYDPAKRKSHFFTRENGLPSNRTNNLMVDNLNRLWIGTSNGLCVMNRDRNLIRRFDVNDGLPANQFNEQAAFRTHDGLFVFPTYQGFAVFRPEDYHESRTAIPLYITSFKISEKELRSAVTTEELQKIDLHYDQNFFSIELAGLNFMNPSQCTYAYKLEPFDKDWIYTRNKQINYTNVPAGDYSFHYKVITDNPNWNVPEKTLQISIGAIFYETWWFRTIVVLLILAGLFGFYRYRIHQRERILLLQNKAQILEKEKALVMYESLKQQLNPHFLFNSLTSLSSLIQQDQKIAKQFLDQMSKIYRYILQNRDSEFVSLGEDIKLAEVYTKLQQTRFKEGLKVNLNIGKEHYERRIVPVSLQNLMENAIKHNIIDIESPLVIDIFTENGQVVVRNNLQKKNFVETSNKQGLANMSSLYKFLTGKTIVIEEAGKYFTVKIPLV